MGHPNMHMTPILYKWGNVHRSQIFKQLNYLDSFNFYCIFSDLGSLSSESGGGYGCV